MSIVHVTGGKGSAIPPDRTLFVGPRTPESVKVFTKLINKIGSDKFDKQCFRKLIQVAVNDFEGTDIDPAVFKDLHAHTNLEEEQIFTIYSGLRELLLCALRRSQNSMKQEIFKEDLAELKIPPEYIPDIVAVVFGSRRSAMDASLSRRAPHLPKLESVRWRVDVGISTSALNRVLQPSVLMETSLSDGQTHNFEVPVAKFHELRYSVATVLKEMEDLEKRQILKIID